MAAAGLVLFALVIVRCLALVIGYTDAITFADWLMFTASVVLLALSSAYALGWHQRGSRQDIVRRARLMSARPVAAPAPAAGRRDASLPTVYGKPAVPQPGARVADDVGMPAPPRYDVPPVPAPPGGWGPGRTRTGLCLVGSAAGERLAEVPGAMGCFWCPHAAPDDQARGWVWFATSYGVCPCCAQRRRVTT
jgi:hypothetical protein